MEVVWNPWGAAGIAALVVAWALAAVVYRAAPYRGVNQRLAFLLAVEGAFAGAGGGLLYLMGSAESAFLMMAITVAVSIALLLAYLLFLETLETPLVAPLRSPGVRWGLVAATVAAEVYWVLRPVDFVQGFTATWYAPYEAVPGPAFVAVSLLHVAVFLYGLVATVSAYRRARPGAASRPKNRAYMVAFGTRDGLYLLSIFIGLGYLPVPADWLLFTVVLAPCITIAFVCLVAYGILKTQLFDIDVKLKWTLKQSTVAGVFVAVFFVVSEGAQQLFQSELGPWAGLAAAGLLVSALHPIQRFAERFANKAMPKVQASPEYFAYRKMMVYRAALESALQDGEMTARERQTLRTLMVQLEIRPEDAAALEEEVLKTARRGTPAVAPPAA